MSATEQRLAALGIELPQAWRLPEGLHRSFEIVRVHDGLAHLAGHGPVDGAELLARGRVGTDLSVEEGQRSARLTALAMIATLRRTCSLDAVTWLRATVFVQADPTLGGPALTRVSDGFSDLVVDVFGERGRHARTTCGAAALTFGVPTIIEATVALRAT